MATSSRKNITRPLLSQPSSKGSAASSASTSDEEEDSGVFGDNFVVRRKQSVPDGEEDSRTTNSNSMSKSNTSSSKMSYSDTDDNGDSASLAELTAYGGSSSGAGADLHPHHSKGGRGNKGRNNRSSQDEEKQPHRSSRHERGESSRRRKNHDDFFDEDASVQSERRPGGRHSRSQKNSSRSGRRSGSSRGDSGGTLAKITGPLMSLFEGLNIKTVLICCLGMTVVLKLNKSPPPPSGNGLIDPATVTEAPGVRGAMVVMESGNSGDDVDEEEEENDSLNIAEEESEGNDEAPQEELYAPPAESQPSYAVADQSVQPPPPQGFVQQQQPMQQFNPQQMQQQQPGMYAQPQQMQQMAPGQPGAFVDPNNPQANTAGFAVGQTLSPLDWQQQQQQMMVQQQQQQPMMVQQGQFGQVQQMAQPQMVTMVPDASGNLVPMVVMPDPLQQQQLLAAAQDPAAAALAVAQPPEAVAAPVVDPAAALTAAVPLVPAPVPPVAGGVVSLLNNFKDSWDPFESTDIPMFWHIPKAGGSSIKDAMGGCHRFVQATEFGVTDGHIEDTEVAIVYPAVPGVADTDRSPFVNVDSTTVAGIQRGRDMGFADAQLAQVVVSPFVFELNDLFTQTAKGRFFSVFRHPIDRAVSMFYYIQVADWEPSYKPELKEWTLDQYATSDIIENNWMTRQLSNQLGGELTDENLKSAMEVVQSKFLVGLMTQIEASMTRFEKFFRWTYHVNPPNQEACRERLMSGGSNSNKANKKPVAEGDPAWELLALQNNFDLQLYAYIESLFVEQEQFVAGMPDEFRNVDGTCCKCDPPTFPPEGFTCPQAVKNQE